MCMSCVDSFHRHDDHRRRCRLHMCSCREHRLFLYEKVHQKLNLINSVSEQATRNLIEILARLTVDVLC
jgi:hypothetical protein